MPKSKIKPSNLVGIESDFSDIPEYDFSKLSEYLTWEELGTWISEIEKVIVPFGSNSGPYDLMYTPYFKKMIDDLHNESIEVVSLMIPAQIGKTLLLLIIGIIWAIRYGVPVYYFMPSMSTCDEIMNSKVLPLIHANKHILEQIEHDGTGNLARGRIKKHIVNFKNGGSFNVLTVGSRQGLKGKTTSLVILDEYAELVQSSPKSLGDVLERSYGRISQYTGYNRKVLVASTPTFENINIDHVRNMSKQFRYYHTCSNCNSQSEIKFEDIRIDGFTKSEGNIIDQRRAVESGCPIFYTCPTCGQKYFEYEKRDMLTRCNWIEIDNPNYDARYVNYSLQGVYGHRTWKEIYLQYLGTKDNIAKLKAFKNEVLSEPWVNFKKQTLKIDDLKRNQVPRGKIGNAKAIATGIDIQTTKHEIYYSIIGITDSQNIALIDWGFKAYSTFDELKILISELHTEVYEGMQNSFTFVDSGSKGSIVTRICWEISKKDCVAVKGDSTSNEARKIYSLVFRNKSHDSSRLETYTPLLIHPHKTNDELDTYISEGYLTIPVDFDDPFYFEHIASEVPVLKNGKTEYSVISNRQNDYRDALRYAIFGSIYNKLGQKPKKNLILFGG